MIELVVSILYQLYVCVGIDADVDDSVIFVLLLFVFVTKLVNDFDSF